MKKVTFITGNQNKADYMARLLELSIKHHNLELDEIQSLDLKVIVEHKARQAFQLLGTPVLVEDVALEFEVLGGLPGSFIKFFVEATGLEAVCRMLDGFETRGAVARCVFAYFDGQDVTFFEGSLRGTISERPKGEGWGWDAIFAPEGYGGRTRAELDEDEDKITYMQIKPFSEIREFLSSK